VNLGVAGSSPVGRPNFGGIVTSRIFRRPALLASARMFFVYILACVETGRSYVGSTDHLIRRYRLHCAGSTRFTRERLRRPILIFWEAFASRSDAMKRERYYKSGSGHRLKTEMVLDVLKAYAAEM
jgi:putative endonuclease